MNDPIRMLAMARRETMSAARWALIAFLLGAGALLGGYAWGQDGPEIVPEPPTVKQPAATYKMERNAKTLSGAAFIRLTVVQVVHTAPAVDAEGNALVPAQTTQSPGMGTWYQRVATIDSVTSDWTAELSGVETTRVYLVRGGYIVCTDSVDEVWSRIAEAGPYMVKPAKAVRED